MLQRPGISKESYMQGLYLIDKNVILTMYVKMCLKGELSYEME